jgi:3-phosphoshikimate 1-carboxyvinyltransferase
MAEELAKFGVTVTADENSATVGGGLRAPSEVLCGHNDHRVVMALATLCTLTGGTIDGAEAVAKSLPDYFERLQKLGIKVDCYEVK